MLYIASALTPTAISHAVQVQDFITPGVNCLVIAKPDRIEAWDITASGLEFRAELGIWGTIVGLTTVSVPDAMPHILVLAGPPNAQLHLVTFSGKLVITSTQPLTAPTPNLRRQEFFTGVVSNSTSVIVSLWTGLLAHIEMELEKSKDAKRRTSIAGSDMDLDEVARRQARRLVFKSSSNINIREHNLLDIAFIPGDQTVLTFLWMSEQNKLQIQPRQLSAASHSFTELAVPTDVVNPLDFPISESQDIDFNAIPFSVPAARNVLAIGNGPTNAKLFLVIGDEHAALYAISPALGPSVKSATSPRASAIRRSPQSETGGIGKKRKSSTSGRSVTTDVDNNWTVKPVWRMRQGFGTVLASTVLENHTSGGSVLLGDQCGRLTAIGWEFEGETVRVGMTDMGIVSPPTALTYLDNGNVFVSSACGDSLIVSLAPAETKGDVKEDDTVSPSASSAPKNIHGKGKERAQEYFDAGAWTIFREAESEGEISVRERWMNIAPVKDFAVVEGEDGRVSHLVVASGSSNTNSLRIVRSGVGFEDVLNVEGIPGVERMWTLAPAGSQSPTLLVSFAESTAVLNLEPEVSAISAADSIVSSPTIAAGLVKGDTILAQITPLGVQLWSDIVGGTSVSTFLATADNNIVAGAVRKNLIVAAFRDGSIKAWCAAISLELLLDARVPREVAAVDIYLGDEPLVAVSDWGQEIQVYTLKGLSSNTPLAATKEAAYASSLLFNNLSSGALQLLAGLSDGSLVSYDLDAGLESQLQKGRVHSSLGTRPLQLTPLALDAGEETVFAAGISERLSIIFESRGHAEVSSSGKKDVVAAATVTTSTLGNCVVLATPEGLCFSHLTSLKKLQVQTLDLYNTSPLRVAPVPDLKVMAVGTVTRTLDAETGEVLQASGIELRNHTTLDLLADFQLEEREAVTSVNPVLLNGKRYIAVGTAIFGSDELADEARLDDVASFIDAEKGRLLLLEAIDVDGKWSFQLVTSVDTTAAVFDTAVVHGFLAAAMSTKVSILRLDPPPTSLSEVSKWTFGFEAHYLNTAPASKMHDSERLVVGDAMRSIVVLDVDEESGEIRSDQHDMSTHSVRALADVVDGGPGVIIANDHANLLTFRLNDGIEPAATFGLHESVARLRPGSLAPASSSPEVLRPDLIFATANGRLGMVGELGTSATRTLDDLQRNMNKYHKGPGGLDWRAFRRGGNAKVPKETAGFIDGDFVQRFADLDTATADKLLRGSTAVESVYKVTEHGKETATFPDVVRILEAAAGMH